MEKQINELKHVKVVVTAENLHIIHKHRKNIYSKQYEQNAKYIAICVNGVCIKELGVTKNIEDWNFYKLMLFRSQEELDDDGFSPGFSAIRAIKKYIKRPQEPYEEEVFRDPNMFLNLIYENNELIKGHFVDIDMRSGEPFFLMNRVPELKDYIEKLYDNRKRTPGNKMRLVALNGCFRNTHVSIYKGVCHDLYDYMNWLWDDLLMNNIVPVAMRRDGIIALLPYEGCKLPESIKKREGENMGDLKVTFDSGQIRLGGYGYVFATDMKKITSKVQGMTKESLLNNIEIYFLLDGTINLKVRVDANG